MPTIHFYDTVTAGRSPTEGQVIRFDSAVYPARGSVDLQLPTSSSETTYTSILML